MIFYAFGFREHWILRDINDNEAMNNLILWNSILMLNMFKRLLRTKQMHGFSTTKTERLITPLM